ncbi:MAG: type II toxin-antitoxin system Phd/YefM family antitoxin [Candidatus Limnocylindria bacterium]
MERVGIRELRQNASEYVRRAEAGETIEVTDRGRAVARLAPLPKADGVLDRLIVEGIVNPATADIGSLGPPLRPTPGARSLSELVDELRGDKI